MSEIFALDEKYQFTSSRPTARAAIVALYEQNQQKIFGWIYTKYNGGYIH